MCDLWQFTHESATQPGSIAAQVESGLHAPPVPQRLKLYNASNFFDPFNVPLEDYQAIVRSVEQVNELVVENHPRVMPRNRILEFRDSLKPRLQVAMGLEVASDKWLTALNKQMTLRDFQSAAAWYRGHAISIRAFILIGLPRLKRAQAIEAAIDSVRFAVSCGVDFISLIPLRVDRAGVVDVPQELADGRPTASDIEEVFERSLEAAGDAVVTVDLWDWSRAVGTCQGCREPRRSRLEQMNLAQGSLPTAVRTCLC